MADNRRSEPGPGSSTEGPVAHRVGSFPLLTQFTFTLKYAHNLTSMLFLALGRHEDGTVRFWDASGVCLYPLYKLSTATVFHADADPNDNMSQSAEGEWPPFRKVFSAVFISLLKY